MNIISRLFSFFFLSDEWINAQDALPQENRVCLIQTEDWEIQARYINGYWLIYDGITNLQVIEDKVVKWKYI